MTSSLFLAYETSFYPKLSPVQEESELVSNLSWVFLLGFLLIAAYILTMIYIACENLISVG